MIHFIKNAHLLRQALAGRRRLGLGHAGRPLALEDLLKSGSPEPRPTDILALAA